jgi:hypothetical protein
VAPQCVLGDLLQSSRANVFLEWSLLRREASDGILQVVERHDDHFSLIYLLSRRTD